MFLKHFISLDRIADAGPKTWGRYYSIGSIEVVEYDKGGKYMVIRIRSLKIHLLYCQTLLGLLPSIIKMVLGKEVFCEETKCIHRGDEYHEFLLKW
jgi:predicted hydrocarbon binding protein